MNLPPVDLLIRKFWDRFQDLMDDLGEGDAPDDSVYDHLLEELQRINPGLFLEFSLRSDPKELVITAEGKKELFDLVETIIGRAPVVSGWTFLALKPKLGFPMEVSWEGCSVTLSDVVFEPLHLRSGGIGLMLYVPDLREEDTEDVHNALLRAIDHGLGERRFAEKIEGTDVAALSSARPGAKLFPLIDLDELLNKKVPFGPDRTN